MWYLNCLRFGILVALALPLSVQAEEPPVERVVPVEVAGITVTPQVRAPSLRYRGEVNTELGARVQLFLRNTNAPAAGTNGTFFSNGVLFDGKEPQRLINDGDWAWHDTPSIWGEEETAVPPDTLVVWSFNTKTTRWGLGKQFNVEITDWQHIAKIQLPVMLTQPRIWLSAVTFLSSDGAAQPNQLVFHVANDSDKPMKLASVRLYLPESPDHWRLLRPQATALKLDCFPSNGTIPAGDKGGATVATQRLPLSYAVVEVMAEDNAGQPFSLWAHVRIKRESFDISGGWVEEGGLSPSPLTHEIFLKTLQRLHVNTAHIVTVPGYTDQTAPDGLYTRYPLKRFGRLDPVDLYQTDAMLPFVHAVEFLGEPQYEGGGTPRFPQAVLQALLPYAHTRLPTTVTLSDESTWRYYAGLSDYPDFDAYRVTAPAADDWAAYDRWEGRPVGWGAPLETIGDLCRSLREMSRPRPIACWSQGPHFNWSVRDGRKRTSPTADEIRLQAYHALSSRVTSLYWYNLSLPALVQFRDTLDEITRIGREIRMLEPFYLEGDAYRYRQVTRDQKLDWDLASLASPRGALLFALDLDYLPDRSDRVFAFRRRREATFRFELPLYLRHPADVFRVDADGIYDARYALTEQGIQIDDKQHKVAIYVVALSPDLRGQLESKRQALIAEEQALGFDPANRGRDFDALKNLLDSR